MKMNNLINVESSQLSDFNYVDIAKRYDQETAEQLESLEHEGNGILNNAKIKFGAVLKRGKELVKHGDFQKWVSSVWGLPAQRVSEFINIAEAYSKIPESGNLFPEKLSPASTMAKAILKAPEENRETLIEELKQEKETKGKDLTEAEIKKITAPYLKQIEELEKKNEQLEQKNDQLSLTLENTEVRIDNIKSYMGSQVESKEREINKANEIIENQNKQIKELSSAISAKESALVTIETKSKDLTQREEELELLIEKKANAIAEETIESEKAKLMKLKKELEEEQKKIKKELAEVKKLKSATEKEKNRLSRLDRWIDSLTDFNYEVDRSAHRLLSIVRNLQDLPDLEVLQTLDKKIVSNRIYSEMKRFHEITQAYGGALEKVTITLRKLDNQIFRAVDVEVVTN